MSQSPLAQHRVLIGILIVLSGLGPFAMQIFVPALPAIQRGFEVTTATAQLAFSLSALSIAGAMLIYGPLSDRFGRRPVVLVGIGLCLLGSLLCASAPSIEWLILGRIVQAAGGAAGLVIARAAVRDMFDLDTGSTVLAYVTGAMVVAPMIAPSIGGVLIETVDWRANFALVAVISALCAAAAFHWFAETNPSARPIPGPGAMARDFWTLLRLPAFRHYAIQSTGTLSAFFAFLAGAPFVVVDLLDRPATDYGLYFLLLSGGFMLGNLVSARIGGRVPLDRKVVIGNLIALSAVTLAFLLTWRDLSMAGFFLPLLFMGFGNGLAVPNGLTGAVNTMPGMAGAASGLVGFMQMAGGGLAAQLVGALPQNGGLPLLGLMLALTALSTVAGFQARVSGPRRRAYLEQTGQAD